MATLTTRSFEEMTDQMKMIFVETQTKLVESSRQLSMVRSQLSTRERERKVAELTNKELLSLGTQVKAYKSVGKMFIQADIQVITKELADKIKENDKEKVAMERAAAKLTYDVEDCQKTLKDLTTKA